MCMILAWYDWYTYGMYMVCVWYAYGICMVCVWYGWYVHGMIGMCMV